MLKSISPVWTLSCLSIGAVAIAQLSGYSNSALAAPLNPEQVVFNDPTPPNQGAPEGRQRGGASRRGPCDRYRPLAALVPNTQKVVFANTSSPHPSFWFYIPEPLTPESSVEFTLLDAQNPQADYTYKTTLTATEVKPGLIRLSVPPSAPPLTVGKSYLWTLSLACNPRPADAVFVQGVTQRVALTSKLQNQLSAADPFKQASLYAANGIWHEAFDAIALQHRDNPKQAQAAEAWNRLLQHIGLQDLAATPFSPCCTATRSLNRQRQSP